MLAHPHDFALRTLLVLLASVALACDGKTPGSSAPDKGEVAEPEAQASDEAAVGSSDRPMMLVFSRDYCTPCQVMKPWVSEIAEEHPSVDVVTVNVDRNKYEHIGSFFQVSAVPSLVFADAKGKVLRRSEGLAKKKQMAKALRELGWVQ